VEFFALNHLHGIVVLGSVVLCITGGEALYADMGHFGRAPIRLSWYCVVLPGLLLNYFGQGALLLDEPASSLTAGFRRMNGPYGGVKTPDLVANVAIKQAWGSAQIMGVLHDDNGNAAVNESKLGYAVGGGVKVLVPMLGAGDIVGLQAAWGKGALGYVAAGVWTANTPFQDFEFTGGQLLQSTAWSVAGGYNHNWTKTLSSSIGGSYLRYDAPTGSAFADFDQIDLQGSMRWKPAAGLSFTAALEYRRIDRAVLPDGDGLVAFFRIQRDF